MKTLLRVVFAAGILALLVAAGLLIKASLRVPTPADVGPLTDLAPAAEIRSSRPPLPQGATPDNTPGYVTSVPPSQMPDVVSPPQWTQAMALPPKNPKPPNPAVPPPAITNPERGQQPGPHGE